MALQTALILALLISLAQTQTCSLPFYQNNQGDWNHCPMGCLLCTSDAECTQCDLNHYLDEAECLECDFSCATCESDEMNCLSCDPLSVTPIFYQNECLHKCPSHFYKYQDTCAECDANCKECIDTSTTCSACESTQVLSPEKTCINCPQNYINLNGECIPCHSSCKSCAELPTQCTECPDGTFLLPTTHTCQASCPSDFYESSTNVCSACDSSCLECAIQSTQCTKCEYDLQISTTAGCQDPTPCDNGFFNIKTKQCQACDANCIQCVNSATQCMECDLDSGYLLDLKTRSCVSQCPSGTFSDQEFCHLCGSKCAECQDDPEICTTCIPGLKLYQEECISECPSHTYEDDQNTCQSCASQCAECFGSSANECSKCPSGQIINQGQCQACGNGKYASQTNTCEPCQAPCANCESATRCLSCSDPSAIFYNGQCLSLCPSGTYRSNNECVNCEEPCENCSSQTVCTSCDQSSESPKLHQGQCLDECPQETWDDSHVCRPCNSNCSTCKGSPTHCVECPESHPILDTTSNICVTECQSGQFQSASKCYPCCEPCNECSFPTHCTACKPDSNFPFLLPSQATCVDQCPPATWQNAQTCAACASQCTLCQSSAINCSACKTGYYLSGSSCLPCSDQCSACVEAPDNCVLTCPNGTYESSTGSCESCISPCLHCTSQTACSSCVAGYYFQAPSSCTQCNDQSTAPQCQNCEDGTYFDGQECVECADECATCSGPSASDCNLCATNYFLSTSGICEQCELPCDECQHSPSTCTSCPQGFYLDNDTCARCNQACTACEDATASTCSSCSDGFYQPQATQQCLACDPACSTCSGSGANTCINCAPRYFKNQSSICQACDSSCAECEGPSAQECTDCPPGYSLINDSQCAECSSNCKECDGPSPAECIDCFPHFYDAQPGCEACHPICLHCNGPEPNQCTDCPESFFLFNNYCVSQCPLGTVQSHKECIICQEEKCLECLAHDPSQCSSCHPSSLYSYLVNGQCLDRCPSLYYEYEKNCLECPANLPTQTNQIVKSLLSCSFSLSTTQLTQVLSLIQNTNAHLLQSRPPLQQISDLIDLSVKSLLSMPPETNTTLTGIILIKKSLAASYNFVLDYGTTTNIRIELHIPLPNHNTKELVAAIFQQLKYPNSLPNIPTVDINIHDSSQRSPSFIPITNAQIEIIFTFLGKLKPKGPVACAYWDSDKWSIKSVSTRSVGTSTIVCTTTHLSSFSIVANGDGVEVGEDIEKKADFILYFFSLFLLTLIFINLAACFCDLCTLRSKKDYYPHRRKHTNLSCGRVFCYSLLYNLHFINICSYRSRLILSAFKALWIADLLLTAFYTLELLISGKFWILVLTIILLGIILTPCSFLQCCLLRRKARPMPTPPLEEKDVNKDFASDRSSKDFIPTQSLHITRSSTGGSNSRQVHSKINVLLFCLFTVATFGVSITVTVFYKQKVAEHFYEFFWSFGIILTIGLVLAFLKVLLASCSVSYHPNSICLTATFVDLLTAKILEDAHLHHAKSREVIEFVEDKRNHIVADVFTNEKAIEHNQFQPPFPQTFGAQFQKQNTL